MNHSKKNNFPITNIGSVTLMMIFIVLCMVSFAALSLSTAASDYQAAKKSAKHVKEYYQASNEAEETLASIADTLETAYQSSSSTDTYLEQVRAVYPEGATTSPGDSSTPADASALTLEDSDNGLIISYRVALNKKQALAVSVLVQYEDSLYRITSWKVVNTTEWKGDNSVKLIGE